MATFSLSDTLRRAQATGNGSNVTFAFSFQVNATSDVKVYIGDTLKTLSTHYTIVDSSDVAGLNANGTGTVKFITSPTDYTPANGDIVTILSDVPVARTSVYTSGGNITAAALESDFDTQAMMLGDREERETRTVMAPVNDPTNVDMTLPAKADRLGKVLGFNSSTGNPEAVAAATPSNSVIKTAYEANSDTNAFTDAEQTKLSGIEANADVTDATNVDAAGAVMNSDLDGKGELLVGDGSGDPTALAVGTNGYVLKANSSTATGLEWSAAGSGGENNQNAFSNVAVSGQSTVEADSATDTLTLAAGSNVTLTTDPSTDTVTIASTDTNTTYSVGDGGLTQNNFTNTLKSKLDGIEASATADQTASEIRTLVESASDSNVFTDADHTKLNGIATSATANPNALDNLSEDSSPQLGGNLDVNGHDIVSTSNGAIDLDPNGSGRVTFKGNSTRGAGQFVLNCEQNTHGVTVKGPPHSAGASYTLTLPDNDGAASEFLQTDGSGNLSWAAAAGGGGSPDLFAENYDGSSTKPSATGTNAVALQDSAVASGNRGFAAGRGAVASGTYSVALGTYTDAVNFYGTAIGYNAQAASGDGATALTNSRASGAYSFAAAIANNTSTYGATGSNSVAIGYQAKATNEGALAFGHTTTSTGQFALALGYQSTAAGTQSVAIGRSNQTGGNFALALGYASNASASNSVAIGDTNTASHANAITIGDSVQSTTTNEVSIGGTADTVRISESYTLPTADGTNGQVLTTNGSGALSFAAAGGGGGAALYIANESSPANQPTAAGANAIGIGDTAQAAGADGVAIGLQSYARAQSALGLFGDAQNTESVSIGKNSAATADGAVQLGRNGYATATDAVSLGKSRASGASSFAAGIANNGSTYGSTGSQSVSIGQFTRATSSGAAAFGSAFANASGSQSLAIGRNVLAQQQASVALGQQSLSAVAGKFAYSSTNFSATGDSQHGMCVLRQSTTDATPKVMLTDIPTASASATNQIVLPNNSCFGFTGTVIARENSAQTNDFAVFEIKGGAVRAANAGTTALGSYNINKISESTGAANWSIALSADTTNGAVAITVTGEASHSIRWVATVNTTEVTY